jgi:broad specificity phosphatase PhoE
VVSVLLIRHGHTADLGVRISGRASGVHLSPQGRQDVAALAARLAPIPVQAIYTSPLERTRETAAAIAAPRRVPVTVAPRLIEVDFGAWTGREFAALEPDRAWRRFNTMPATARVPDGESLQTVAERACTAICSIAAAHAGGVIALVTHGDVIRLGLSRLLQVPLAAFRRVEIAPASATWIDIGGPEPVMRLCNFRAESPACEPA